MPWWSPALSPSGGTARATGRAANEAARRHRGSLRLPLAAHRRRRHGGVPRTQDALGRYLSLANVSRTAALLQPGPARTRSQHDDGALDRVRGVGPSGRSGRPDCLLPAHRPSDLRCRPAVDPSRHLALAAGHPGRAGLGRGRSGAGRRRHHGPRRAHRLALRGAGRRRVLPAAEDQAQSGLSDRGVGPDRPTGALARIHARDLAAGDLSLLCALGRAARRARHADRRHLAAHREATFFPLPGQRLALDLGDAVALRHVVGIEAVEADSLVPNVVAIALPLAVTIGTREAVDGATVLEPLRLAAAGRQAGMASALPNDLVFGFRMPVPHTATRLGADPPSAAVARLGPADLYRVRLARRAIGLGLRKGDLLRKGEPAGQQQDRGHDSRQNSHGAPRRRLWRLYGKNA